MAITITPLLDVNPAYNDSIVTFSSSMTGMTKADIIIGAESFTVYPFDNQFVYNFKDVVKVLINQNGFQDSIIPDVASEYIYDDTNLQLTITPQFSLYNNATGETTSASYTFIKSAEQLIGYKRKLDVANDVKVLLPTRNNFDYYLTIFEGFPVDFAIQGISSGDTFCLKNTNNSISSDIVSATTNEVKRIFISDGGTDTTVTGQLPLTSNLNKLELYKNDAIKANIWINKVESRCGVYLKWFNSFGSYSYWLFEPVFRETIKTKDYDDILGTYDNLQNVRATSLSLGKSSLKTWTLSTNFREIDRNYVADILESACVEMYIHQDPFIKFEEFDFVGVKVSDGSFNFDNKTTNNKLKLTVELPAINTVTY